MRAGGPGLSAGGIFRVRLQRLGKNIGRYYGETIDINEVLDNGRNAARRHGWSIEEIPVRGKRDLLAFKRKADPRCASAKRVYISAGIHGDEPAGPLAVSQLLGEDRWPEILDLSVLPCLNPTGFILNTRESDEGLDLNRQYLEPKARETIAHIEWLRSQVGFDLCLCLHEDWEAQGFYVYELNPDNQPSLAETMVEDVSKVCPIDPSAVIEGRAAANGIIRPNVDLRSRPQWPESFYLLTQKTRHSYTLEAPSDFPTSTRVSALVTAVRAATERFGELLC